MDLLKEKCLYRFDIRLAAYIGPIYIFPQDPFESGYEIKNGDVVFIITNNWPSAKEFRNHGKIYTIPRLAEYNILVHGELKQLLLREDEHIFFVEV